ncbi:YcxB family protein [Methylobrevis pamukkalensis]|nr:YcxB family protein [Methylobrevis pamukkalensis]
MDETGETGGSVDYQLTEADVLAASRAVFLRGLRRSISGTHMAGSAITYFVIPGDPLTRALLSQVVMVPVTAILHFAGWHLQLPANARRQFARNPQFQAPRRLSWSDAGIAWREGRKETKRGWQQLHDARESRDLFVFYDTPQLAEILPKRVLTKAQIMDLSSHVARRKVLARTTG